MSNSDEAAVQQTKKKVLVIGGGFAGLAACVGLRKVAPDDNEVEIVLVEPKDFFEVAWCSFRTPFDEILAQGSTFLLEPWAAKYKVQHVRATVNALTSSAAVLSNGETIDDFDLCVIGTGGATKWAALGRGLPSSKEQSSLDSRLEILSAEGKKLLSAKHVLVVGGGLIGVELAGDLKSYSKLEDKDIAVTLVHSGEFLCNNEFSKEAAEMVQSKLEAVGVKVILNDRAEEKDGQLLLKSSGEPLEGIDEVVYTVGLSPINSSFIKESSWLDDKGWLQVDEYLCVKGDGNDDKKFFALGDCCNYLPNAGSQILGTIGALGRNMKAVLDGKGSDGMEKIAPSPEVYVATIGKDQGVAMTYYFHTQYILPWLKNSTMFLFRVKAELGL